MKIGFTELEILSSRIKNTENSDFSFKTHSQVSVFKGTGTTAAQYLFVDQRIPLKDQEMMIEQKLQNCRFRPALGNTGDIGTEFKHPSALLFER